jgi:hypothetical protein
MPPPPEHHLEEILTILHEALLRGSDERKLAADDVN